MQKLAMALPFCFILGGLAALLREHLSSSMRLRPRIEEALEIPVIAVIPASPSEVTIDWERFKRPMALVGSVVLAHSGESEPSGGVSVANGAGNGRGANGTHGPNGTNGANGHSNGHANGKNGHGNGYTNGGSTNGGGVNGYKRPEDSGSNGLGH